MSDIRDLFRTEPSIYAFVAIIMLVGPVKKNAMMIDLARERRSRIPSPSLRRRNRVKLRELAVTVAAPDRLAARLGASAVRLTVAGRNLLTWAR